MAQSVCLMTCGKGNLWPYPTGNTYIGSSVTGIQLENIVFKASSLQIVPSKSFNSLLDTMNKNFQFEILKLLPTQKKKNNYNFQRLEYNTFKKVL